MNETKDIAHKEPPEVGYEDIFSNTPYLTEDWGGGDGKCCYIDQVYVPPGLRGQGLGKELFRKFLSGIPEHVERIRLKSCELSSGHTKPFWESLGFQSAYEGDIDGPDGDLSDILVMGVNGHTTPPPEVLTAETNWRELHELKADKLHVLAMACSGN